MQTMSRSTEKKGWRDVPCTRLDRGITPAPPSLRTHSVPIIPSLQEHDRERGHVDGSRERVSHGGLAGPGYMAQAPAGSSSHTPPNSSTSVCVLELEDRPSHMRPYNIKTALVSETSPIHTHQGSSETLVGPGDLFQHSSLVASGTAESGSGVAGLNSTNTFIAVTVLESKKKSMRYTPRLLYSFPKSRGPQAGVQREAQGLGKQNIALVNGGANSFLSTVVGKGAGISCAKLSAS